MEYSNSSAIDIIRKMNENGFDAEARIVKQTLDRLEKNNPATHAFNTAGILAELGLDKETIIAALLHNTVKSEELKQETAQTFDKETLAIVEEATKIDEIEAKNFGKIENETLSKIILATAKDIRTVFIKLAEHLNEIRFLGNCSKEEQRQKAEMAMELYAPICHKLGQYRIEWELQDLAFKKLKPKEYAKIKEIIKEKRPEREKAVGELSKEIESALEKNGITATLQSRAKGFYSIYKKIMQKKDANAVDDLFGARVICASEEDCYKALGAITARFEPTPNGVHDYIATPKPNGYKSIHIHTRWKNKPTEIQVRTWGMHKDAEEGIAAHWQYKQFKQDKHFDKRLALARQVAEWQQSSKDARQHIESLNIKFEKNQVFVFTPKKELIVLPEGATPIDFAYAVHSGLGNKCEKAKANGKIVPLDYRLENADAVEIITSERQKPKSQWLSFVKTDKAKQRIRQSLRIEGIMDGIKKKISAVRKIVPFQMKKGQQAVLAKCCNPLPGDEVVGYKTTKRKIKVHRADCPNLAEIPKEKRIAVPMEQFKEKNYRVEIAVKAQNKPGILTEMLDAISSFKAGINSTSAKTEEGNTFGCTFNITIKSSGELEKIVERLEKIKGVIKAERK